MAVKLAKLIETLDDVRVVGESDVAIEGLDYDSRRIKPGMLFAAITGYRLDGKRFIPDALKNGAVAIMTDAEIESPVPVIIVPSVRKALSDMAAAFYGFPGKRLFVIGVTGTNGKSTSVFLIQKILQIAGIKAGLINSLVYDTTIGKYKAERTTPDSVEMQKYLAEMVTAGCTHAVIEVSSHALVLHRVDNIDFKAGLFTNFSRDHLDFHKTMGEYLSAKKSFLDLLDDSQKYVVINKDVAEFASFANDAGCQVVTYSSEGNPANVTVLKSKLEPGQSSFELAVFEGRISATLRLPGRYNLANAVGAAAVGVALGIKNDDIEKALGSAEPIPGRFEPVIMGQPFTIIIDYAHTPDAIERLCLSAGEITSGRVLTLFGCGGDRDTGKRPLMAEAASRNSDMVILTSDNPRTEDPDKIISDALPGMVHDNYRVIPDRSEAIHAIIDLAEAGDAVLLAGKGAEDYQEIGAERFPFSDREEAIRALGKIGFNKVNAG
jgi:UDP-N-acetylmuramoyl-L-alanyl-D-glutamate--2,6-diaminopimelate ligase